MTKHIGILFAALVVAVFTQLAAVTEASAQYRCGPQIHNGTIHIFPPCGNRGWQRDSRGQRYWGPAQTQRRAYYKPLRPLPPKRTDLFPQQRPAVAATNYIPGAPRNVSECYARGGTLANGGRGCAGYR